MATVIIVLIIVALGATHWAMSRTRYPWLGALIPALWVGGVAYFLVSGQMDSVLDYAMAVVGLSVLVKMWADGRAARAADVRTA